MRCVLLVDYIAFMFLWVKENDIVFIVIVEGGVGFNNGFFLGFVLILKYEL